jgi:hypothetical protein
MTPEHLEILVEEPSSEAFLIQTLPKILNDRVTFMLYVHQGKVDLLQKLEGRLRGYAAWLPQTSRVVVLIDRDDDECAALKHEIEEIAAAAGLRSRTRADAGCWQVVNRIAIEELEAWFFGAWDAVRQAYPRVPATIPQQAPYRNPDGIAGGTWEAFERVLQRAGYFAGGLRKVEAAREIGRHFDPRSSTSESFLSFRDSILESVMPSAER